MKIKKKKIWKIENKKEGNYNLLIRNFISLLSYLFLLNYLYLKKIKNIEILN